jgi:hypothetical protein
MVVPKKLSREVSRPVSRLRLRGCRSRTPSSIGVISDRGVVTSLDMGDDGSLPVEWSRPNALPRPFVTRPLVSLYETLVSL